MPYAILVTSDGTENNFSEEEKPEFSVHKVQGGVVVTITYIIPATGEKCIISAFNPITWSHPVRKWWA